MKKFYRTIYVVTIYDSENGTESRDYFKSCKKAYKHSEYYASVYFEDRYKVTISSAKLRIL